MSLEVALIQAFNVNNTLKAVGLQAYLNVPVNRPARFITVERVGGGVRDFVGRASLAIQVWAKTRLEASELAETVSNVITTEIPHIGWIAHARVENLYNFPDPDSDLARYQLTVSLHTLG